jgi:hypothetical protein
MSDGDHDIEKEITVELDPGKITLKGEKDRGWARVEIEAKDAQIEHPVTFGINPEFLKHILNRTRHVILSPDKGLFEKDTFRHLIGLTPK